MRVTQPEHAITVAVPPSTASCHAGARAQASAIIRGQLNRDGSVLRDQFRYDSVSFGHRWAGWQRDAAMRVTQHEHALAAVVARGVRGSASPRDSRALAHARARTCASVRELELGERGAARGGGVRLWRQ